MIFKNKIYNIKQIYWNEFSKKIRTIINFINKIWCILYLKKIILINDRVLIIKN